MAEDDRAHTRKEAISRGNSVLLDAELAEAEANNDGGDLNEEASSESGSAGLNLYSSICGRLPL